MEKLYENIRKLRIEKGISQDELAQLTGYKDRSSITKIESGKVDLAQSKILLFAKVLNTTPADLMGLTEDDDSPEKSYVPETIAAHFEGKEFSQEALDDIANFIDYIASKEKRGAND